MLKNWNSQLFGRQVWCVDPLLLKPRKMVYLEQMQIHNLFDIFLKTRVALVIRSLTDSKYAAAFSFVVSL